MNKSLTGCLSTVSPNLRMTATFKETAKWTPFTQLCIGYHQLLFRHEKKIDKKMKICFKFGKCLKFKRHRFVDLNDRPLILLNSPAYSVDPRALPLVSCLYYLVLRL